MVKDKSDRQKQELPDISQLEASSTSPVPLGSIHALQVIKLGGESIEDIYVFFALLWGQTQSLEVVPPAFHSSLRSIHAQYLSTSSGEHAGDSAPSDILLAIVSTFQSILWAALLVRKQDTVQEGAFELPQDSIAFGQTGELTETSFVGIHTLHFLQYTNAYLHRSLEPPYRKPLLSTNFRERMVVVYQLSILFLLIFIS